MNTILTICPWCGCGCSLLLREIEGKIVETLPSSDSPVNQGRLCVKGWNCYEYVSSPLRLVKPLMRERSRGYRKSAGSLDDFREVSWRKALKFIASKFKDIREKKGSVALGLLSSAKCTNEENYLMMKLARAVLQTNNIDHCARLCHSSTVVGLARAFGSGAMTNSIEEIEKAEVILVTGSNITEQHPEIGGRIMRRVLKGAKLILVDPRNIHLAKFATLHLRPRPGTDVAWINGLIHVILKEGLADLDFIDKYTENFLSMKEIVKKYTPKFVEEITGIPAKKLMEAARIYGSSRQAMIFYAMGITQHVTGTDNVLSLANLSMVTGNVGRPSTGVNPLRGQNNVQGACDMGALPDFLTGYQKVEDGDSRKKFEQCWDVKLPTVAGLTETEMFIEGNPIQALYIMGENPLLSEPNIGRVEKFMESLEFLVVQDIFFTETARWADVILPGSSFAEKDGTFTSTERRIQRVRKVVEPVGESQADWKIICQLAKELGYLMEYSHPAQIMEEISSLTPIYGGVSYSRLDKIDGLQWPCAEDSHPGTLYLHKGGFKRGKGLFTPVEYKPPQEITDEEYPFLLTTGRIYQHWHTGTMSRLTFTLQREVPQAFVEMNPRDGQFLGIRNRQLIKVISRRGEIIAKAFLTEKVGEKTIFIPFHFSEAAANRLTLDSLDPQAKIPEYKVCAVKIELWGENN